MAKTALITGISGQDGAYLARFLIRKGYKVIGLTRKLEGNNFHRLEFLGCKNDILFLETDLKNLKEVKEMLEFHEPNEIYNLAAQSSVGNSFKIPGETFAYNTLSVINLLEAIRGSEKKIKFYQASSSEMFGNVSMHNLPIKETLLFKPVSPYGISKASAHWLTINYREAYGLFAACGILFNHESCLRGENFVIKKIVNTALKIASGEEEILILGNLAVSRDWGYAPKYVEAMWKILQKETPEDFVICSGNLNTLQDIVVEVFDKLSLDLTQHLRLDQRFMRSLDLGLMYGDNSKANQELDWNYNLKTSALIDHLIEDEKELIAWKKKNQLVF